MKSNTFNTTIHYVAITGLLLFLSACAKPLPRGDGNTNFNQTDLTTPPPVLDGLPGFNPATEATATEQQTQAFNNNQFGGSTGGTTTGTPGAQSPAPFSYIPLGNTLSAGYFSGEYNPGFYLDVLVGQFGVTNQRLLSYPDVNTWSMATLGYSFPDVYMGGIADARGVPGTEAAVFARHHDTKYNNPSETLHCHASCVLVNEAVGGRAEIRVLYGNDPNGAHSQVLSSRPVPAAVGSVECVMYKKNIAMYFDGVLVGLVEDSIIANPNLQSSIHESFFGFLGNGSSWGKFTVVDMQRVANKHRVIHYSDKFDRPSEPNIGPQWIDVRSDVQILNKRLVPLVANNPAEAVMTPLKVNEVDVRAKYSLQNSPYAEAGILFGHRSGERYSARVFIENGLFFVGLFKDGTQELRRKALPLNLNNFQGTIRVVVEDRYVQVYVNNQMRIAKRLPSKPLGSVGVRITSAEMDDFSVGYP